MQNSECRHYEPLNIRCFVLMTMAVRIRTIWSASPCSCRSWSRGPSSSAPQIRSQYRHSRASRRAISTHRTNSRLEDPALASSRFAHRSRRTRSNQKNRGDLGGAVGNRGRRSQKPQQSGQCLHSEFCILHYREADRVMAVQAQYPQKYSATCPGGIGRR